MRLNFKNNDTLVHLVFLICIIALVGAFLFLLKEVKNVRDRGGDLSTVYIQENNGTSSPVPVAVIKNNTSDTKTRATAKPEKRTAYINLNGTFSTSNTDWVNIASTDTVINLANDYGKDAYVDWDAAINISSSGSKVFVRLYDATHNIAVNGSELASSSIVTQRVASGRLYFWSGQNTYRVQIKSLNGAEATFGGGRIKIVY